MTPDKELKLLWKVYRNRQKTNPTMNLDEIMVQSAFLLSFKNYTTTEKVDITLRVLLIDIINDKKKVIW